ncbi:hypothetical protein [Methylobacterium iners]|uniref:Uncharacterized protein n=1 Tax=Methylobacterium iners TaxID=418707 RepID=A0ABQ4RS42_9HYPH|nr:hypothetical protein [Methylobacterium iners]GJD93160.1 hypothetical protein OCOJLMKI_0350 [Methylobacterium iners]
MTPVRVAVVEAIRVRDDLKGWLFALMASQNRLERLALALKNSEREARRVGLREATDELAVEGQDAEERGTLQAEANEAFRTLKNDLAQLTQQISVIKTAIASVDEMLAVAQARIEGTSKSDGDDSVKPLLR